MQLTLKHDLLLTGLTVEHGGNKVDLDSVVLDTGSARTLLSVDALRDIRIFPEQTDTLHWVSGVGGAEVVFSRRIDALICGDRRLESFEVEVGGMDYGLPVNGILGLDFLLATRGIIDLGELELTFPPSRLSR